jgi:hypothetical protein
MSITSVYPGQDYLSMTLRAMQPAKQYGNSTTKVVFVTASMQGTDKISDT